MIRRLINPRGWAAGLFWAWNIFFIVFMILGFAPQLIPELLPAVRAGVIPTLFLVYAGILVAIPFLTVIIGALWLRREPFRLFVLGYGIEGPLMLMLALRFFLVQEITPGVAVLIGLVSIGLVTLFWDVLDRAIDQRGPLLTGLRVAGLTGLLAAGLYACVWIAFFTAPLAGQFTWLVSNLPNTFLGRDGIPQWQQISFTVVGTLLFVFSVILFILMPVAVPLLYVEAWRRGVRALAAHQRALAAALPAAVLAACIALFVLANRQPQQRAFALLETPPSSPDAAAALLQQQETIRAGLLNAYLAPQRYFGVVGKSEYVGNMYHYGLGWSREQTGRVEQWYEAIARPILYEPVQKTSPSEFDMWGRQVFFEESLRAGELYEQFFDLPINRGERDTVVSAVRSTWMVDQARNAWLAVDDREILLTRQELTITEHGDWADMELYEVYQNQTGERQEVVYYFNLPESAVITGVWLGNSPDRDRRFVYQVAPRGAAQSVYREQVRIERDPALVEQIGPRQYRLRVFPVEPQQWRWDTGTRQESFEEAPALHMWLTWRVLAQDSQWSLPRLAEKRNVYWDANSVRLVNGAPMQVDAETWLPAGVPAAAKPITHRIDFPNGESVIVRPAGAGDQPLPASDLRLAVVLDRSRSMARHAEELRTVLARLRELGAGGAPIDVYLTASPYRGEQPAIVDLGALDTDRLLYYGGQNPGELLAQFSALRSGQQYDAILVLTDDSGYELGESDLAVAVPDAPVWMIHLGGFPLGYDDPTLEAIQASGGGVAGTLDEALTRLTIARAAGAGGPAQAPITDVIDGYVWLTIPAGATVPTVEGEIVTHAPGDAFGAFAARRIILAAMQRQRDSLKDLAVLDRLHATAIEHSIVTPFSSMLVLVNQQQQRRLDELEGRDDRFQREHEQVGETTPETVPVTGVPEPEEWLLIGLAVIMLLWYLRRERTLVAGRRPVS